LKSVLANVVGIDESSIVKSSSPDTVEALESLIHMSIVVSLEKELVFKLPTNRSLKW